MRLQNISGNMLSVSKRSTLTKFLRKSLFLTPRKPRPRTGTRQCKILEGFIKFLSNISWQKINDQSPQKQRLVSQLLQQHLLTDVPCLCDPSLEDVDIPEP